MNDIKIYALSHEDTCKPIVTMGDNDFIETGEGVGKVYTLSAFESAFNEELINSDKYYIRVFEVRAMPHNVRVS